MHSAFGFIQPPRFARDPTFMGSSNNPSKRSTVMGGRPPRQPPTAAAPLPRSAPAPAAAAAPPRFSAPGLLDKRCEFLEAQLRRLSAELVEVSDAAAAAPGPLRLQARVLREAAEFGAQTGDPARDLADAAAARPPVPAGAGVHLLYPMHQVTLPSGRAAVVMRRLQVDPQTAQPADSWLVVHQPAAKPGGRARYTVGDFRLG